MQEQFQKLWNARIAFPLHVTGWVYNNAEVGNRVTRDFEAFKAVRGNLVRLKSPFLTIQKKRIKENQRKF